jgi:hypothetical protein
MNELGDKAVFENFEKNRKIEEIEKTEDIKKTEDVEKTEDIEKIEKLEDLKYPGYVVHAYHKRAKDGSQTFYYQIESTEVPDDAEGTEVPDGAEFPEGTEVLDGAEFLDVTDISEIAEHKEGLEDTREELTVEDRIWQQASHDKRSDMLIQAGRDIWEQAGELVRGIIEVDEGSTGYDAVDGLLYVNRDALKADTIEVAMDSLLKKKEREG